MTVEGSVIEFDIGIYAIGIKGPLVLKVLKGCGFRFKDSEFSVYSITGNTSFESRLLGWRV
jgi:hypothetical protein